MLNRFFEKITDIKNWIDVYNQFVDKNPNKFKNNLKNISFGKAKRIFKKVIRKIKRNEYEPKSVKITLIPKPNGKMRKIGSAKDIDKVFFKVISNVMYDAFDKYLSKNCFSYRKRMNVHNAIRIVKAKVKDCNYILKYDIKNFFDEIDHDILISKLKNMIDDNDFIRIINIILKINKKEDGLLTSNKKGIVQGLSLASVLSNIYLSDFDSYIDSIRKKFYYADIKYFRFADDFIIGSNNEEAIREIQSLIEGTNDNKNYLEENLRLSLNQEKTKKITFNENSRFSFLGIDFKKVINRKNNIAEISVSVGIEDIITRLTDRLILQPKYISKYIVEKNFRVFSGILKYYCNYIDSYSFNTLIDKIEPNIKRLCTQRESLSEINLDIPSYEVFLDKIKERIGNLLFYNGISINDYCEQTISFITNRDLFIEYNYNSFHNLFKRYNVPIPTIINRLENLILQLIEEINRLDTTSKRYESKVKKIIYYTTIHYEIASYLLEYNEYYDDKCKSNIVGPLGVFNCDKVSYEENARIFIMDKIQYLKDNYFNMNLILEHKFISSL
jgi:RNA-directed DNA polymerase